ncbi:MAG: NAD-dependent epimerase/dehydratase family protein [Candidatus Izemoplasmatales bacterium]|jgi:dihydroflavonol-4-reductase
MIYVTGATGHIGNNFVRLLLDKGIAFTILQRQTGKALVGLDAPSITGDIFDRKFLGKHIRKGDILVHIAGFIDLKDKYSELSDEINNIGTKTIVDFCQGLQVRLIYTSSVDCIYRDKNQIRVAEPDNIDFHKLRSGYAISKAKGTKYLLDKINNEQMNAVILYPSAVIGANDYKPSAAGLEIYKSLNKRLFFYIKGGYNFIDVADCALALLACIQKPLVGQYILAGHNMTIKEFYKEICSLGGHSALFLPIPGFIARLFVFLIPRFSKVMIDAILDNYQYDNSRMRRDLVMDLTPFSVTVRNTIMWLKSNYKGK